MTTNLNSWDVLTLQNPERFTKSEVVMVKLEDRKLGFIKRLRPYLDQYGRDMLNDFCRYWTEHNEGGKKMRFEMQKVFNIKMRLITWHKNTKKYERIARQTDKNGNPIDPRAYVIAAYTQPGNDTDTGSPL